MYCRRCDLALPVAPPFSIDGQGCSQLMLFEGRLWPLLQGLIITIYICIFKVTGYRESDDKARRCSRLVHSQRFHGVGGSSQSIARSSALHT